MAAHTLTLYVFDGATSPDYKPVVACPVDVINNDPPPGVPAVQSGGTDDKGKVVFSISDNYGYMIEAPSSDSTSFANFDQVMQQVSGSAGDQSFDVVLYPKSPPDPNN